jgi:hypothetical protein
VFEARNIAALKNRVSVPKSIRMKRCFVKQLENIYIFYIAVSCSRLFLADDMSFFPLKIGLSW